MKILLASDTYLPLVSGNVVVVDQTARALAKRGHQVFLLVPGSSKRSRLVKQKNLTIFYTGGVKNPLRLSSYLPLISASAWRFLSQVNPDVIHIHTPGPIGLLTRRFGMKHRKPLVVTVHGMPDFILSYFRFHHQLLDRSFNQLGWSGWRLILKPARTVIAPADYVAKQLRHYGVKNQIKVLPFWIEFDRQLLSQRKQQRRVGCIFQSTKSTFLYYGRLDKDKNIDLLIHAWAGSSLARKKAQLLVVGGGKEVKTLERLVDSLSLQSSVKFLGMIPDASFRALGVKPEKTDCLMEELYDQADFFIIASNIETQCITGYLAVLFGLPVIGSSKGALPELVSKTPYPELVFRANDVWDLSAKIDRVIKHKSDYQKYLPPEAVIHQYSQATVLAKLEAIYRQAS